MTVFFTPSRTPAAGPASATCTFRKGFPNLATPATVTILPSAPNTILATVSLGTFATVDCSCAVDCSTTADVSITAPAAAPGDPPHANYVRTPFAKVCPASGAFSFAARVNSPSASLPTDFLLEFTDVFGNVVRTTVRILRWVEVKKPVATLHSVPDPGTESETGVKPAYHYATIQIPFESETGGDIESAVQAYQVERYLGHPGNRQLIRGWVEPNLPSNPDDMVWDYVLLADRAYGYRVRYRSAEGDVSPWSGWEVLQT